MARAIAIIFLLLLVAGCGGKVRQDWGGGGTDAQVVILNDRGAVELAIWEGAIVYDLRDYDAWAQGHITGARRITLDDITREKALPNDRNAPVLFTGEGPLDTRPERAAELALERGYTRVMLFPGGWRAYVDAHPVRE
ncbi:MAG: rhodanese-like domain-containing protein [Planctomycetes bacterium]|nr:rhodanese-like domain-containing protein [Planctomycetota bacterium]